MNKHLIYTYTDSNQIHQEDGQTQITVYWQVQFNRELDGYFTKRKYVHDFELFKEGVGRLNIRIEPKKVDIPQEAMLAYAESLALKHVVSTKGLNAFGFTSDKMTIRRDHIHFYASQPITIDMIDRAGKEEQLANFAKIGPASSVLAAYVYGATISLSQTNAHLKDHEHFEHYNTTTDMLIRMSDQVRTDLADLIINYRTCEEFLNNDFIRYTMAIKGAEYSRVYNTIAEYLMQCTTVVYDNHPLVERAQKVFGETALIVLNEHYAFQLVPANAEYVVYGFRKSLSAVLKKDMIEAGFGDGYEMPTDKELADSQKRREQIAKRY